MTPLIIFDLDGVLMESRDMHYETLNAALMEHGHSPISRADHLSTYDGMTTKSKLARLGIPERDKNKIWLSKQKATLIWLDSLPRNERLVSLFASLKNLGFSIGVVSNAMRVTTEKALNKLGLGPMTYYLMTPSNELRSKPFPDMYWAMMRNACATARTTYIVEDSHIGREGALNSGATLIPVEGPRDVTLEYILSFVAKETPANVPWMQKNLNILIPMAGEGSRFVSAGYTFPKPLIEVNGKPMIQIVRENLNIEGRYIYILQYEHEEKYGVSKLLEMITPSWPEKVYVDGKTQGAACTALLASMYIDNDKPLLIVNSDQYVEWNPNEVMYAFSAEGIDGGIVTFPASHPKWSYVRLGDGGFVAEVAEKRVISNRATVGIYYWRRGSDFVKYAKQMIDKGITTNGEFYIAPVFNEAIADGKKIRTKDVKRMWGLGDPESLNAFLEAHK